ncbi:NAD(P)H-dependent oxidoreductase [Pseudomonas sp. S 311-6]|nr:NAD(P)H-dependent oxidoreductase [Pseudomonas sp. S 311-6]
MNTLLRIDSSAHRTDSITRQLTDAFTNKWTRDNPNGVVVIRDLDTNPLPHLTTDMVNAFFTPEGQRTAAMTAVLEMSDKLVDELLGADTIVIGAPMYNLTIPSSLKAWIDHIARAGRTFRYSSIDPEGLVIGKKVVVCAATGGDFRRDAASAKDFVTPYLRALLAFLGMTDVTFVTAPGVAQGEYERAAALAECLTMIAAIDTGADGRRADAKWDD